MNICYIRKTYIYRSYRQRKKEKTKQLSPTNHFDDAREGWKPGGEIRMKWHDTLDSHHFYQQNRRSFSAPPLPLPITSSFNSTERCNLHLFAVLPHENSVYISLIPRNKFSNNL